MTTCLQVNQGKTRVITSKDYVYECLVIRTPLITKNTVLEEVIHDYVASNIEKQDIVFVSEKIIAIMQNRAIELKEIKYGKAAKLLSRFVTKTPHGIGLGIPETMQCAIDEVGLGKILIAATASAIGKVIGKKGWFYKVAGKSVAAIDGPCDYTIPPFNRYVVLGPKNPDAVAKKIHNQLDNRAVLIVDCNDLGVEILGSSGMDMPEAAIKLLLKQNPLGQSCEQTPIGILRKR